MASSYMPKFSMNYIGGNDPDSERNTLIEGGPLLVDSEHWIHTAKPDLCIYDQSSGKYICTLHYIEYIFLDVLEWPDHALERGFTWYLKPKRVARFLAKADAAGVLKWERFTSDYEMVKHLRECASHLPPEERKFVQDDMHEFDEPAPITKVIDRVRAIMFKDPAGLMTTAVDFKTMLSDAYTEERRNDDDGHHKAMLHVMLDASSPHDLASKPLAVQASTLIRFVCSTQPPPSLRRYLPYELQELEIHRRGLPTESERFIPIIESAWSEQRLLDFKELRMAVPHACTGAEFIDFIKLLSVRAQMSENITETSCHALCDMLRGDLLSELDTDLMRRASNQARCSKLGDLLAVAASRSRQGKGQEANDKDAAEKMRSSPQFKDLMASLEALVSDKPDYRAVIKLLAPTAVGRIYINGGAAASPLISKFAAIRHSGELDSALNSILAVDEAGLALGKTVVLAGWALKILKSQYASHQFDPWMDMCKGVIAARDGLEAANAESQDRTSFWSDHSRLVLSEPIMQHLMGFAGHTGRSAGSYISFHAGMTARARQVKTLPSNFLKKEGLRRMLAKIGGMVMTEAASRDATMLMESVGIAHIRTPFFLPGSLSHNELTAFDKDLAEARSKARLHDDYGDDEDGNFRKAKYPRYDDHSSNWWQDNNWDKEKRNQPGSKLDHFSVYLTKHGLLYGCKFLVRFGGDEQSVPHNTCLGSLSYGRNEQRRNEWCSKKGCFDHKRPGGLGEDKFHVINIHATDNSEEDAKAAKDVMDSQSEWTHFGGAKNFDIMGGKGGRSSAKLSAEASEYRQRTSQGPNASPHASRGGKGKGGKGKGGKGKGGKGKGKGGEPSNFGRRR